MKRLAILAAAVCALSSVSAQTNVGVSIGINQPGVYGRINIGNLAPPAVVYAQPVVVEPTPVAVVQQPIYIYVPVVQQQNWPRYCKRYGACGQPVYFVKETWVRERHYHEHDRDDDDGDRRDRKKHKKHKNKHKDD